MSQLSSKSGSLHKSLRHFAKEKQHFSGDFFSRKSLKRTCAPRKKQNCIIVFFSGRTRRNVSRKEHRGQKETEEDRESEKVLNFSYLDCYAVASLELSLGELSWGKMQNWPFMGHKRQI